MEVWKPVYGYEGRYEVSDLASVRSVLRVDKRGYSHQPEILRPYTRGDGYVFASLRDQDGRRKKIGVHRLVLLSHSGPGDDGMECAHNDGNPGNNKLSNLRWATRSDNHLDKREHGTMHRPVGEKSPFAKLDAAGVVKMFEMRAEGKTFTQLSAIFGIGTGRISNVLNRKSYRSVEVPENLVLLFKQEKVTKEAEPCA